jgi:ElaB/YqjD/DUF883 family membrane-anchored ribosome-binding protein
MEPRGDIKNVIDDKLADLKIDIDEGKRKLSLYGDKMTEYIKANPGKCVAGAVAVGFLLGKLARR